MTGVRHAQQGEGAEGGRPAGAAGHTTRAPCTSAREAPYKAVGRLPATPHGDRVARAAPSPPGGALGRGVPHNLHHLGGVGGWIPRLQQLGAHGRIERLWAGRRSHVTFAHTIHCNSAAVITSSRTEDCSEGCCHTPLVSWHETRDTNRLVPLSNFNACGPAHASPVPRFTPTVASLADRSWIAVSAPTQGASQPRPASHPPAPSTARVPTTPHTTALPPPPARRPSSGHS